MDHPAVTMEIDNRICTLTLNDPGRRNAMTEAMSLDFEACIKAVKRAADVKVLVITGAGRAFCAGGDLDMIEASGRIDPGIQRKTAFEFYNRFLSVRHLEIPTIAAVNGHAVGAGACLALACHMRLAAQEARIGFTFARLGLHPGMGAEHLLIHSVGAAKTYELLMTCDMISAKEAMGIGLFNHVVPRESLMAKTRELADKIRAIPDLPIQMMVDSIPAAQHSSLEQTLRRQAAYQAINYTTADFREGVRALREGRKPKFS